MSCWIVLAPGLFAPAALQAQWRWREEAGTVGPVARSERVAPTTVAADTAAFAPMLGVTAAGVLGVAAGVVAGAYIGSRVERKWYPCDCDDPGLEGAIVGGIGGSSLFTPLAVHLANHRRGPLGRSYGAAALLGTLGVLGTYAGGTGSAGAMLLVVIPVAQVITAVGIETSSPSRP
jgi:hypothetical protein